MIIVIIILKRCCSPQAATAGSGRREKSLPRGGSAGKPKAAPAEEKGNREFAKGGLAKGDLAIYAFPLCDCNTLGSVFNVQIENMPNC